MAGHIPREFINDLLARADIVELIDARVPLKKAGSNYHACCPFHNEKTPSFTVSHTKQFYHCFGCGVSGNALGFLIAYDRLDFVSAVELLANQLGLVIPRTEDFSSQKQQQKDLYSLLAKASNYYQQQLRISEEAIQYLKRRGVTGEIAKRYQVGFAPAGWDKLLQYLGQPEELLAAGLVLKKEDKAGYYDRFRERIMFPIRDRRGRVIAFGGRVLDNSLPKYLNSPETAVFHKSSVLYGLYEARQSNRELAQIIVVEGYMDVLALAQAGISYAVATLGTATTTAHVQQLFHHTQKIIFCFDGDRAGKSAAWRALESALSALQEGLQVQFLFLPEGEDPDTLIRKEGQASFMQRLQQAVYLPDFLLAHCKSQVNMNTLEGRAQLVHLALPLIDTIPAPILHEMLLDKLAEVSRLDKQRLSQLSLQPSHEIYQSSAKLQKTPMRLAIALLLQFPRLADQMPVNFTFQSLTLPGSELFKEIVQLIQAAPHLTTGGILEYWRENPVLVQLNKLAAWEHHVPEEGLLAEWHGILQHLLLMQREHDVERLINKANVEGLTSEEKVMLQKLLSEK